MIRDNLKKETTNSRNDQQEQDSALKEAVGYIGTLKSLLQQACNEKAQIEEDSTNTQPNSQHLSKELEDRARDIQNLQRALRLYQHQVGLAEVEPEILENARQLAEQPYDDRTTFDSFHSPPQPIHSQQPLLFSPAPDQAGRGFYPASEYYPPQPQRPPPPPPTLDQDSQ